MYYKCIHKMLRIIENPEKGCKNNQSSLTEQKKKYK